MTPKKKSNANTKKANLLNQISDSKKFNLSKCKGESVVEPWQMDIIADGTLANQKMTPKTMKKRKRCTKKSNLFNQITDSDNKATHKFSLFVCQHKKRKLLHHRKGKNVVEMDIVASQGIVSEEKDLMAEILSWLPVRSLFRFKCISKSWDITSDPYFKMKHYNHHTKDDVNSLRFLVLHYENTKTHTLRFYSSSSLLSGEDVQNLEFPSNCSPCSCQMFGSCHGLVLLGISYLSVEQLVLWNPSTRESILLPLPEYRLLDSTFGFGYDSTTNDYKILAIYHNKKQIREKPSSAILALKDGSWRKICKEGSTYCPWKDKFERMDPLVFVHGTFHWVTGYFNPFVVSLSISDEAYRKIPLLDPMRSNGSLVSTEYAVSVLDGMLCFSSNSMVHGEGTFKVWAMKNYGVKESWTEIFNIKITGLYLAKPMYRFADGDVLFYNGIEPARTSKGRFGLWSDSLLGYMDRVEIITFNESLISPKLLI